MSVEPREVPAAPMFWRSLEERAGSVDVARSISREFTPDAGFWDDATSRRQFLKTLGASLALAGLAGCVRPPDETIVAQVESTGSRVPGHPQYFATAIPFADGACGVMVTSIDGRPIKIEGNPRHPASLGATPASVQASILDLYDPDRSQVVRRRDDISFFGALLTDLKTRLDQHRSRRGQGLRLLTRPFTSPTLLAQLETLLDELPDCHWHTATCLPTDHARIAAHDMFGSVLEPYYQLSQADVVLCVDADPLGSGADSTRLAREFAQRRRISPGTETQPLRLYAAEPTLSITGAAADHRLILTPSELPAFLTEIARRLGVNVDFDVSADVSDARQKWIAAVAADLQAAGRRSLIAVGPALPVELHRLAYAVNARSGALGNTLELVKPQHFAGEHGPESFEDLLTAMETDDVETLIVLEANPAYASASAVRFARALENVGWSLHAGQYFDETAVLCTWHVPTPHVLETWSDCRHRDGTASLIQPLIAPLFNSQSLHTLLEFLNQSNPRQPYDIVRDSWQRRHPSGFEAFWRRSLLDGVITEPVFAMSVTGAVPGFDESKVGRITVPAASSEQEATWTLAIRPDPYLGSGLQANNSWLQELPKPWTTLTWGNAALVSPDDAARAGWQNGDVLEIKTSAGLIRIPLLIVPGEARRVCTLHLGHGRRRSGRHGQNVGVDVTPVMTSNQSWNISGATLTPVGERKTLAIAQPHQLMENRDLIRTTTFAALAHGEAPVIAGARGQEDHAGHHDERGSDGHPPTLFPPREQDGPQWGMVIDLASCLGCSACTVACQAENNIPSVGAEQVNIGRRMHWLRVDTYFSGEPSAPEVYHQPVMCMHCEHAPCEPVCPVAATTHSPDGLNEMTYNRCIGTRYCSNNCPYKVRRFNFLDYHQELKTLPVLQLQPNPEVTVRSRGVMEKCTYCVQRIRNAGIAAQLEDRELKDGDIVTACQAACPTGAIVFGNLADKNSRVTHARASERNYGLLEELNTRPRTTYQAAVHNPNPALAVSTHREHRQEETT